MAHSLESFRGSQRSRQRTSERFNVEGREDAAVHSVVDQVGLTSDLIGNYDGPPGIHRFIDYQAPGLMGGR